MTTRDSACPTDEDLIARANRAYFRRFPGGDFPGCLSAVAWHRNGSATVALRNGNGVLARYHYRPASDRLSWLP